MMEQDENNVLNDENEVSTACDEVETKTETAETETIVEQETVEPEASAEGEVREISEEPTEGVLSGIEKKRIEKAEQKKKRSRLAKMIALPIVAVLVFIMLLNLVILPLSGSLARGDIVTEYSGDNQYIALGSGPMLSAHRAGGGLQPEETLAAFELCMDAEYTVDIVEFDVHLTKDGKLVLMHDHEVDRTSDGPIVFGKKGVKVQDKTLAELKELNFGYNFEKDGNYPYRVAGANLEKVRILALDEILEYLETRRPDGTLNYIIEIKDSGEVGKKAMDELVAAMQRYNIIDRTVVGTFHDDITKYIDKTYKGIVKRSASIMEFLNFYFAFLWGRDLSKVTLGYDVLQIPMGLDGFYDFSTQAFISYAHSRGIAVQYWTINDPDDVKKLQENGADAIMTDDPLMASIALGLIEA